MKFPPWRNNPDLEARRNRAAKIDRRADEQLRQAEQINAGNEPLRESLYRIRQQNGFGEAIERSFTPKRRRFPWSKR